MVRGKVGALLVSVSALPLFALAVPAAAQTSAADGQQAADVDGENAIVVTGRRGSIEAAADLERNSDVLKSIVTADDIGQFGDPTVAESLQRIPGLSINRQNGEGQQVSIRGLPTEFATVTVDGARLGTTDPDINSTNLDFFSADNLSQIEVTKALTPEQDADAIAGSINLKTNSAFRRGKDSVGGRAEVAYDEKRESWNPKVSGDFTKIFNLPSGNRIGLAGSVTWSQRKTFTDDVRVDDGLEFVANDRSLADPRYVIVDDCTGSKVVECFLRPQQYDFRGETRNTDRLSVNGALEFEFGDTVLEFRGTYSQADTDRYANRQTYIMERSEKAEIIEMGPDFGELIDSRTERRMRPTDFSNTVYTLGFDGKTEAGDWTVTYGGYYARNKEDMAEMELRYRADDVRLFYDHMDRYGINTALGRQSASKVDPLLPESYTLVSDRINERFQNSVDKNWVLYYDIERKFSMFGNDAAVKIGAKYRNRTREFNFDRNEIAVTPGESLGDFSRLDPTLSMSDLPILFDPPRSEVEAKLSELRAGGTILGSEIGNSSVLASVSDDYTGKEEILAGYSQFTVRPAANLQVIAGVRMEASDFSSWGSRVRDLVYNDVATTAIVDALTAGGVSQAEIDVFRQSRLPVVPVVPFQGGNDYLEFFPSVNLKWEPLYNLVVRLSYSEGLKRPEFREAAAVQQFVTNEKGLEEELISDVIATTYGGTLTSVAQAEAAIAAAVAAGGKPQFVTEGDSLRDPTLDPLTSQNFDASVAWYPSRNTVLSVSGFYKKIKNFIFPVGVAGADVQAFGYLPDDGTATGFGVDRFNTFVNGDKAKIYGVEFSFYQAFRFLPKPLDGFYVEGNVTLADSEATAPLVDRTFPFPDQSNMIGNLSVGYENDLFSLRGAAVYQGSRLRVLNEGRLRDANDMAGDLLEDKRTQFDISARVNVTKDIQFYFDALNITNAGDRRFFRGGNMALTGNIVGRNEQYGATYQGGVRVRF
ncbi:TonB-dependent receptor [Hephaestia caeni]|uniref:TonB-dependent receptor n=1 Tax=Hephaestia caeni TaxID=645617 RepID=A0A397PIF0_9SPHN|nr:TonB-dependent receptor [Hephaestia caeni]RIA46937.1 TonB-dependent receptor [Hephaestia caeni]